MRNWKRLDPWFNTEDFIGCYLGRMNNDHSDVNDVEGVVTDANVFGLTLGGIGYLTTPYHTDSKWYVDVDRIPQGRVLSRYILDFDPPHIPLHSQDEWAPDSEFNQRLKDTT